MYWKKMIYAALLVVCIAVFVLNVKQQVWHYHYAISIGGFLIVPLLGVLISIVELANEVIKKVYISIFLRYIVYTCIVLITVNLLIFLLSVGIFLHDTEFGNAYKYIILYLIVPHSALLIMFILTALSITNHINITELDNTDNYANDRRMR
ncbi:MAG: hypothetical protein ACYDBB_20165 [Armatimonadota bacterium]